jgi:adenosine deaminase
MADQKALKDALISAFERLKEQDVLLSTVRADLDSLKEALFEKDAATLVRYEELFAAKAEELVHKTSDSAEIYDAIIEILKHDGTWMN